MRGERYWSTGITLRPHGDGRWGVALDYQDDGFCQKDSTEGTLRLRYLVAGDELPAAIATLKDDAERLGIEWKDFNGAPWLYIAGDGEDPEVAYPPDWRHIMEREALRLGWRTYLIPVPDDEGPDPDPDPDAWQAEQNRYDRYVAGDDR